jgi:hypothetical protein
VRTFKEITMLIQKHGVERLGTLYAMLGGIPDIQVDLYDWRFGSFNIKKPNSCGTVACALGWACAYPPFNAQGLYWHARAECPALTVKHICDFSGWPAVANFFGMSRHVAETLFVSQASPLYEDSHQCVRGESDVKTDRLRVMRRIRRALMINGSITAERNAELASEEGSIP